MKNKKIRISKYDKEWSLFARHAQKSCEYCGVTANLNAHHFKGRACKSTRLMMDNAVILCVSHHVFNSEFSAHKTPEKFQRWFKKKFPVRYRAIIKKAQTYMTEKQAITEFINET